MTTEEYNEAAALVVRLRKELEHTNQHLVAHIDALTKSNAQCGKLLVQNEQLTAELDRMKGDPRPIKLVGKLKDAEDSNKTLHSQLVEVRAALASVTEQRDSLRRTLDEWSNADTRPHARIDPPIRMGLISETGPVVFVRIGPEPADDDVADHVVPPVLPLCMKCHGCGMPLGASANRPYLWCTNFSCNRETTQYRDHDASPYWGPCKSATPVRHE